MSYSISCECGVTHTISATQAGSHIACRCGKSLEVPTLSSLRRSAGESPIPQNTVEKIRAMIREGLLPSGDVCPYSGRPANLVMFFHVQCERSWVRHGDPMNTGEVIGYTLLLGWIGALLAYTRSRSREERGRNTSVSVPVCISSDVRMEIVRLRQSKLKALLRQTPIYAQLLEEYPEATVSVGKHV